MNDQLFEMLRDRLDSIDNRLGDIRETLNDHIAKDETYWQKIDVQEGQIDLLKWMFGGTITTTIGAFFAWIVSGIKG